MKRTQILCTRGNKPITPEDQAQVDAFVDYLVARRAKQPKPLISQEVIAKHDAAVKGVVRVKWDKK